ncbi:MAG: archaellin/type IV pilin N-terminal domain-containing protein [Candidatus Aenigmatarchaeota archaeon]
MKKGLSPLVATIILVAIFVGATAVMGPQIIEYIKERTGETREAALEDVDCRRASMNVKDVICDENTRIMEEDGEVTEYTEYELRIEVENRGSEGLTDFSLQYFRNGEEDFYYFYGSDEIISGYSSRTLVVNKTFGEDEKDLINNITDGVLITGTCPDLSKDIPGNEFQC